jgi:hypothetical protein
MQSVWDIFKKELAFQGFKIIPNGVAFRAQNGENKKYNFEKAYNMLTEEIGENATLMRNIWIELCEHLITPCIKEHTHDNNHEKIFISALKGLAAFLDMFSSPFINQYKQIVKDALCTDIVYFSPEDIVSICDFSIVIDLTHRMIEKLIYIRRLIRSAAQGKDKINETKIVTARGISGPWANLDLPMLERVWDWDEESENFSKRDESIKKQRRYSKGLRNYNNGGPVGEGHYWREIRNEPYSWYSSENESPYPSRSVLRWN